ncbi:MAG: Beta-glucosidase A [Candidatus Anoxychlamydiales bacterium]|nr:Beta-glucosidase A [Candidatus Anoxychlamydiales bacterium]
MGNYKKEKRQTKIQNNCVEINPINWHSFLKKKKFMSALSSKVYRNLVSGFLPANQEYLYNFENDTVEKKELLFSKKIYYYSVNFFSNILNLSILPFAISLSSLIDLKDKAVNRFYPKSDPKPNSISEEELFMKLSENIHQFGFSDSLFQSCGLGTKFSKPAFKGVCDWDAWVTNPQNHIEGKKEDIQSSFRNYLDNPATLIKILNDMNVTAYRFSLEWSVIQPSKNEYDPIAIEKYKHFCKSLKEAGIEPWVTLNHFVLPKWFADNGGFNNDENISCFVKYAETIIPLFDKHVTTWMTFNEPGIDGFQREIRKMYPGGKGGISASIKDLRNILIAHYAVYKKIKKISPNSKIGITHQWLKFIPANSYNPIERIVSYALSLITHYSVLNTLKTGSLKIPFLCNFKIWEDKKPPIDFIGVQSYGYPVLKVGFGSGKEPGVLTKYKIPLTKYFFVAGATCKEEGGKVSSLGPPFCPDDLEESLEEAKELNVPIAITETGCDAKIQAWGEKDVKLDEKTQKEYFEKIFIILTRFKLTGMFIWTLFKNQLEWENGTRKMSMGLITDIKDHKSGEIKRSELSSVAEYIQRVFQNILKVRKEKVA